MKKTKLLLVEDDPNLGDILQEYLILKGYDAHLCKDGDEGWNTFKNGNFDLCILDVMLPFTDGFSLAGNIRQINKNVPIIFLTAKGLKEDKLQGFKIGGDDYMTKPFSMEELQLRVEAVLRRAKPSEDVVIPAKSNTPSEYTIGHYQFSPLQQTLQWGDQCIRLTTKETALLKMLCEHKNEVLARDYALKAIWGDDNYFNGRSMDVFITRLRKYLKEDETVEIMNVHGHGYKLIDTI